MITASFLRNRAARSHDGHKATERDLNKLRVADKSDVDHLRSHARDMGSQEVAPAMEQSHRTIAVQVKEFNWSCPVMEFLKLMIFS